MDNNSRSASPQARPQQRPPSPPANGFDNRAYQHDDNDDPNHNHHPNDSYGAPNGKHEPNGDTKTLEAVNLELINLAPKNGHAKSKKEVAVDMNATNPYDEYFVPVNEHKKYMRGEKLYVTADKRGEKTGCKRPLCWTIVGLIAAAAVVLIVLAATGLLFSNTPTPVEQYNATISSARALGGIEAIADHTGPDHSTHDQSEHDHSTHDPSEHDHSTHDQSEHDHSTHDQSEHDHSTHDQSEHDHSTHDQSERDHSTHDHSGHNHSEHDHSGHVHSEQDYSNENHNEQDLSGHEHSEHDHSVHAVTGYEDTKHGPEETQNDQNILPVHDTSMYVANTLEGELKIDNREYSADLSDAKSETYKDFASQLSNAIREALFNKETLENGDHDISVEIVQLKKGSVIVTYRVHWKPKMAAESSTDAITSESIMSTLTNYLDRTDRMLNNYHVAEEKTAQRVLDKCQLNNNNCEYGCEFDERTLNFKCTCPHGQIIDTNDDKKCIKYEKPEHKVLDLELGQEHSTSGPIIEEVNTFKSVLVANDNGFDWKETSQTADTTTQENLDLTYSHVFGKPTPAAEPQAEPEHSQARANSDSNYVTSIMGHNVEPTSEPSAEPAAEPSAEPAAEPSTEPAAEPSAEPAAEPSAEPAVEPSAEPKAEPSAEPTAEPSAEPTAEPSAEPTSEPSAEPKAEPSAEPKAEPSAEPKAEPSAEPTAEPSAEPTSEPSAEPKAEPSAEPAAQPSAPEHTAAAEPSADLAAEPTTESAAEPSAAPAAEPTAEPTSKHSVAPSLEPKYEPVPEPTSEPAAEPSAEPAAEPTAEHATEPSPKAAEPIEIPATEPTSEPIAESKAQPMAEFTSEPVTHIVVEHTVESASEPQPESEIKPNSGPKAEPAVEPTAEPTTNSKAEAITEPSPSTEPKSKSSEAQPTAVSTAEPAAEPEPASVEVTTKLFSEVTPESEGRNVIHILEVKPIAQVPESKTTVGTETTNNLEPQTTPQSNQLTQDNEHLHDSLLNKKVNGHEITTESTEDTTMHIAPETQSDYLQELEKNDIPNHDQRVGVKLYDAPEDNEAFIRKLEKTKLAKTTASTTEIINKMSSTDITLEDIIKQTVQEIKELSNTNTDESDIRIEEGRNLKTNDYNPYVNTAQTEEKQEVVTEVIKTSGEENNRLSKSVDKDFDSTNDEWLTLPVTEKEEVTTKLANEDTEMDYLSNTNDHLIDDMPVYGMAHDYDDGNVKRMIKDSNPTTETEDSFETTTISEYIYKSMEKSKQAESVNDNKPAPVWETTESNEKSATKNDVANKNIVDQKVSIIEVTKQNATAGNKLNITIYEVPKRNTTTTTPHSSPPSQYHDHEIEMNPFLPEIENNKNFVQKLLEGHDLETINNETQNENNEHNSSNESATILTAISEMKSPKNLGTSNEDLRIKSSNEEQTIVESGKKIQDQTSETGDENKEEESVSTFLTDTSDLPSREHTTEDSKRIPTVKQDDEYLSVMPINEKSDTNNNLSNMPNNSDRTLESSDES